MNKLELVAWAASLPDNVQATVVPVFDNSAESPWTYQAQLQGSTYINVYHKTVVQRMQLQVIFTTTLQAEIKRDLDGNEHFANKKVIT